MTEYKVWAFARSAAPNLPALEEQLAEVMREADRRGYIIVNSCMEQKYGTEFCRKRRMRYKVVMSWLSRSRLCTMTALTRPCCTAVSMANRAGRQNSVPY